MTSGTRDSVSIGWIFWIAVAVALFTAVDDVSSHAPWRRVALDLAGASLSAAFAAFVEWPQWRYREQTMTGLVAAGVLLLLLSLTGPR
jgi:uncharacterized membrane protein YccC